MRLRVSASNLDQAQSNEEVQASFAAGGSHLLEATEGELTRLKSIADVMKTEFGKAGESAKQQIANRFNQRLQTVLPEYFDAEGKLSLMGQGEYSFQNSMVAATIVTGTLLNEDWRGKVVELGNDAVERLLEDETFAKLYPSLKEVADSKGFLAGVGVRGANFIDSLFDTKILPGLVQSVGAGKVASETQEGGMLDQQVSKLTHDLAAKDADGAIAPQDLEISAIKASENISLIGALAAVGTESSLDEQTNSFLWQALAYSVNPEKTEKILGGINGNAAAVTGTSLSNLFACGGACNAEFKRDVMGLTTHLGADMGGTVGAWAGARTADITSDFIVTNTKEKSGLTRFFQFWKDDDKVLANFAKEGEGGAGRRELRGLYSDVLAQVGADLGNNEGAKLGVGAVSWFEMQHANPLADRLAKYESEYGYSSLADVNVAQVVTGGMAHYFTAKQRQNAQLAQNSQQLDGATEQKLVLENAIAQGYLDILESDAWTEMGNLANAQAYQMTTGAATGKLSQRTGLELAIGGNVVGEDGTMAAPTGAELGVVFADLIQTSLRAVAENSQANGAQANIARVAHDIVEISRAAKGPITLERLAAEFAPQAVIQTMAAKEVPNNVFIGAAAHSLLLINDRKGENGSGLRGFIADFKSEKGIATAEVAQIGLSAFGLAVDAKDEVQGAASALQNVQATMLGARDSDGNIIKSGAIERLGAVANNIEITAIDVTDVVEGDRDIVAKVGELVQDVVIEQAAGQFTAVVNDVNTAVAEMNTSTDTLIGAVAKQDARAGNVMRILADGLRQGVDKGRASIETIAANELDLLSREFAPALAQHFNAQLNKKTTSDANVASSFLIGQLKAESGKVILEFGSDPGIGDMGAITNTAVTGAGGQNSGDAAQSLAAGDSFFTDFFKEYGQKRRESLLSSVEKNIGKPAGDGVRLAGYALALTDDTGGVTTDTFAATSLRFLDGIVKDQRESNAYRADGPNKFSDLALLSTTTKLFADEMVELNKEQRASTGYLIGSMLNSTGFQTDLQAIDERVLNPTLTNLTHTSLNAAANTGSTELTLDLAPLREITTQVFHGGYLAQRALPELTENIGIWEQEYTALREQRTALHSADAPAKELDALDTRMGQAVGVLTGLRTMQHIGATGQDMSLNRLTEAGLVVAAEMMAEDKVTTAGGFGAAAVLSLLDMSLDNRACKDGHCTGGLFGGENGLRQDQVANIANIGLDIYKSGGLAPEVKEGMASLLEDKANREFTSEFLVNFGEHIAINRTGLVEFDNDTVRFVAYGVANLVGERALESGRTGLFNDGHKGAVTRDAAREFFVDALFRDEKAGLNWITLKDDLATKGFATVTGAEDTSSTWANVKSGAGLVGNAIIGDDEAQARLGFAADAGGAFMDGYVREWAERKASDPEAGGISKFFIDKLDLADRGKNLYESIHIKEELANYGSVNELTKAVQEGKVRDVYGDVLSYDQQRANDAIERQIGLGDTIKGVFGGADGRANVRKEAELTAIIENEYYLSPTNAGDRSMTETIRQGAAAGYLSKQTEYFINDDLGLRGWQAGVAVALPTYVVSPMEGAAVLAVDARTLADPTCFSAHCAERRRNIVNNYRDGIVNIFTNEKNENLTQGILQQHPDNDSLRRALESGEIRNLQGEPIVLNSKLTEATARRILVNRVPNRRQMFRHGKGKILYDRVNSQLAEMSETDRVNLVLNDLREQGAKADLTEYTMPKLKYAANDADAYEQMVWAEGTQLGMDAALAVTPLALSVVPKRVGTQMVVATARGASAGTTASSRAAGAASNIRKFSMTRRIIEELKPEGLGDYKGYMEDAGDYAKSNDFYDDYINRVETEQNSGNESSSTPRPNPHAWADDTAALDASVSDAVSASSIPPLPRPAALDAIASDAVSDSSIPPLPRPAALDAIASDAVSDSSIPPLPRPAALDAIASDAVSDSSIPPLPRHKPRLSDLQAGVAAALSTVDSMLFPTAHASELAAPQMDAQKFDMGIAKLVGDQFVANFKSNANGIGYTSTVDYAGRAITITMQEDLAGLMSKDAAFRNSLAAATLNNKDALLEAAAKHVVQNLDPRVLEAAVFAAHKADLTGFEMSGLGRPGKGRHGDNKAIDITALYSLDEQAQRITHDFDTGVMTDINRAFTDAAVQRGIQQKALYLEGFDPERIAKGSAIPDVAKQIHIHGPLCGHFEKLLTTIDGENMMETRLETSHRNHLHIGFNYGTKWDAELDKYLKNAGK